ALGARPHRVRRGRGRRRPPLRPLRKAPMPPVEEPFAIVNDDIVRGLSAAFEPVSDLAGSGFEMSHHFSDIEPISNGEVAAVVWTYRCKHIGWFGTAPPSNQVVTIRGTTVIDNRGKEPL